MRLILASSSPRRRELLKNAGFDFEVRASSVVEIRQRGESAEDFARRAAREKALDVAASASPGALVLGADTVVVTDGEILGKPSSRNEAVRMLRALSDRSHRVITAVCLVEAPDRVQKLTHEITFVTFGQLDDEEIRDYVSTGEPFDKSGAYGIQGRASKFISRIEGCYFNVVGLPVTVVYEMLKPFLKAESPEH